MASITYWNRIEPSPRSDLLTRALGAQVRDPLWFLTRQWQFGEFRAEDAASPAYVRLLSSVGSLDSWQAASGSAVPLRASVPLETDSLRESFTADAATRVELGQTAEQLFTDAGLGTLVGELRTEFGVARPTEAILRAMADTELAAFLRVCGGRATDGVALYEAARLASPGVPTALDIGTTPPQDVADVLADFMDWVTQTFGEPATDDPVAWRAERLEYQLTVNATGPALETVRMNAYPSSRGEYDWSSFDVSSSQANEEQSFTIESRSVMPANVSFRGMANKRWWHFERAGSDFGEVRADRRELGKLAVLDFMLVHGNDWFVVPVGLTPGALLRVHDLLVHDVFGGLTRVQRADGGRADGWTLFATAYAKDATKVADYIVVPPSAGPATLTSEPLERVRFLRDEMANMAWALEATVENGAGRSWDALERDRAASGAAPTPTAPSGMLRYIVQTSVPVFWHPLLPVPVRAGSRAIALEVGAMLDYTQNPAAPIMPVGRVLQPADVTPYRIREEEIPRSGSVVTRVARRARGSDGSTHLWSLRIRSVGAGEGSSGLKFDQAV